MVGHRYENYIPITMRNYASGDRIKVLDEIFAQYGDKIGLVAIDGYADLMVDTNDNVEAVRLANQLMSWCDTYRIHITGILHTNPKSDKMRGHIGSEVARKAATVLRCQVTNELAEETTVSHAKARDMRFKKFEFTIEQGLPVWREPEAF